MLGEDEPGATTAPRDDAGDHACRLVRQGNAQPVGRSNPRSVRGICAAGKQRGKPPARRRGCECLAAPAHMVRRLDDIAPCDQVAQRIQAPIQRPAEG
jgi:hypothetical protein